MTEPRFDPTSASADPGGCMPGCVYLETALFVRWPNHRGDAGCYLHGGKTDSGSPSFHSRGRAIDIWIATGHLDVGTQMFEWCYLNRNDIGLNEVIFNGRIWRADNLGAAIHAYTANPHRDHIHIALNLDGARAVLPFFAETPTDQGDDDLLADERGWLNDLHESLVQSKGTKNRPMIVDVWKNLFQGEGDSILTKEIRGALDKIEARLDAIEQKIGP